MKKLLTILFILCAVQSFAQYPGPYQGTQRSNLLFTSKIKFTNPVWFTDSAYLQGYARTTTPADGDSSLRIPTTGWVTKNYQPFGTGWLIGGNSDAAPPYLGTWANKELIFITDSTERMVIPADGILRSSGARNKVLSFDTVSHEVFYTDPTAGGGGTYTASNGISLSTADFQLGGALTGTTSITGSQTLNLGTSGSKLSSLNTNTSGNQGFVADGTISATAPLVYLFGTDSTIILNLDETTDPLPAICRAPNGRLYWKTISGGSADTGRANAQVVTGYSLNKVRDSLQANIGAKVDTLSMGVSHLAADFTTSSTTAVNTGLSFYAAANTSYKVTIVGTASKATSSSGMKLAIGAPSGCTVKGFAQQGGSTLSSALTNSLITAINTLGSTFATGTGVEVVFRIEATVSNGSTAGLITLDAATVTSNVATVYAEGTSMQWHKSTAQ